jgi:hypothetical protein
MEKQLQQQAVLAKTAAISNVGAAVKAAKNAVQSIENKAIKFKKELVTGGVNRLFLLSIYCHGMFHFCSYGILTNKYCTIPYFCIC